MVGQNDVKYVALVASLRAILNMCFCRKIEMRTIYPAEDVPRTFSKGVFVGLTLVGQCPEGWEALGEYVRLIRLFHY
jgi:hypothetical protein